MQPTLAVLPVGVEGGCGVVTISRDRIDAKGGPDICMDPAHIPWDNSSFNLPHPLPLPGSHSVQSGTLGLQPKTEAHSFFRRAEEVLFFELGNSFLGPRLIYVAD